MLKRLATLRRLWAAVQPTVSEKSIAVLRGNPHRMESLESRVMLSANLLSQSSDLSSLNSPNLSAQLNVASVNVSIPDAHLLAAIRTTLNKPAGAITDEDLLTLTSLVAGGGVQDLTGLEYATNLHILTLNNNQITDLTPLSGLTHLTTLDLANNQVTNLAPLSGLTTLTHLYLANNGALNDVGPLYTLTNLIELNVSGNQINNISALSTLTHLTTLDLAGNLISDLSPLQTVTTLTTLDASNNQIAALTGLGSLTNLTQLTLDTNRITSIAPLASLTNLRRLYLNVNQISDISPLTNLTLLQALTLDTNKITSLVGLAGKSSLTYLILDNNQITDLTPLAGLTTLPFLSASNNQISDLSPLAGHTGLITLFLNYNQIVSVAGLSNDTNLLHLELNSNQIVNLAPLNTLNKVQALYLNDNQITAVNSLSTLTALRTLYLEGNQLTTANPLATLTNLQYLSLRSNQVTAINALNTLVNLQYFYIDHNQITSISSVSGMTSLGFLAAGSNQITDLTPLAGLTSLAYAYLDDNQLTAISTLTALNSLQLASLTHNNLDLTPNSTASNDIQTLQTAGVTVYSTPQGPNTLPTVSNFSKNAVENINLAFAVADFTSHFNDADAGDTLQRIRITTLPAHGVLLFEDTVVPLNAELPASFTTFVYRPDGEYIGPDSFAWTASDGVGYSIAASTVSITVDPGNHAPTDITLSANSIAENQAAPTPVGTLGTVDPDNADTFTYSLVTGVGATDNASFTIVNDVLQANASLDYETVSSYSIRVRSTDQGGFWTEKVFTISVTNVNEPPVNTVPGAQADAENTNLVFSTANNNAISIADPDIAANPMRVSLTATHGTLTLASTAGLSFTVGDGTTDATMTFTGTVSAINTALDGLTYIPTANYTGAATLQIVSNDQGASGTGGAQSDTDTVNITVSLVNHKPTFTASNPSSVAINAAAQTLANFATFDPGAVSESAQTVLHYTVTNISNPSLFSTAPFIDTDGTLHYTPAAKAAGKATFQVTVQDDGGTAAGGIDTSDPQTFTISVNDTVNLGANGLAAIVYSDADGSRVVTYQLGGSSQVSFAGTNLTHTTTRNVLYLTGSNITIDNANVTASTAANSLIFLVTGGNGLATVGSITGSTPLAYLGAAKIDLIDSGIQFTGNGAIGYIQLHSLLNGADIVLPGAVAGKGITLLTSALGAGSDITLGSKLFYLNAASWSSGLLTAPSASYIVIPGAVGASATLGSLTYASLGAVTSSTFNVTGEIGTLLARSWQAGAVSASRLGKLTVSGDFLADLTLTGANLAAGVQALGSASVAGAVGSTTWDINGSIGTLLLTGTVGAANNPWQLQNATTLSVAAFGNVVDADASFSGAITSLYAKRWQAGSIDAASAKLLYVYGSTSPVYSGDLSAIITLSGAGVAAGAPTLNALVVTGWLDNSQVRVTGDINYVGLGGIRNTLLFAGVQDAVSALPVNAADFNTHNKISTLAVNGIKGSSDPAVLNSVIAAWTMGTVVLAKVDTASGAGSFGLAAHTISPYYVRKTSTTPVVLTALTTPADYDHVGHYLLRIV